MTSVRGKTGVTQCVLITTLVVLLSSLAVFAQGNFGRILGRVTDPTGAVLPGASISIIDTQRGLARTDDADAGAGQEDRKSTRLNSSHEWISYAVFCLKKKKKKKNKN